MRVTVHYPSTNRYRYVDIPFPICGFLDLGVFERIGKKKNGKPKGTWRIEEFELVGPHYYEFTRTYYSKDFLKGFK